MTSLIATSRVADTQSPIPYVTRTIPGPCRTIPTANWTASLSTSAASSAGTFAKDYERTHGAEVTMRETKQMLRMKTGFAMAQAGQRSSTRFSGLMAKLKEE